MTKPEIIITAKGHAGTMATLQAEFASHLLADAAHRASFLKQHAGAVRGLATFGPMAVDGKLMDALPKLEIISNFGVGVDAINLDDAKQRKIIVTNTPDVLNECVADTAIALVLNTLRKFPQSEQHLRAGNWVARGAYPLTTSLGYPGEIANPKVKPLIDDAIRRIRKSGKAPGILTPNEADARHWLECGALFVAVGSDVGILARGAEALAGKFKKP